MVGLVFGGAASGKSVVAERLVVELGAPAASRVYIATMEPRDEEGRRRIERHHRLRAQRNFTTLECYRDLVALPIPARAAVLLESLGMALTNALCAQVDDGALLSEAGRDAQEELVLALRHLEERSDVLVVVAEDVFCDGCELDEFSVVYRETLARLDRALAERADVVIEVVCGLPIVHRGRSVVPW